LFSLVSFSQDSVCVVKQGQIVKYRKGYLITPGNDTLRGLIWIEGDGVIYFIREGIKIKTPVVGKFTKIPYITAYDGSIKSFYRNGLFYEIHNIPPYNNSVFLEALERGPMTLYRLITDYIDAKQADSYLDGSLANEANYGSSSVEEFYTVKAYYVQKQPGDELVLIPGGEKKFREAFYPLIKDNPVFLKELTGQAFDYYHLRDLVKQYNSTLGKNTGLK
jgi:hypothetical protein